MAGTGTLERELLCHCECVVGTEGDLAHCDDPKEPSKRSVCGMDPVPAENEHDRKPCHTSGERPCHAAGALACEVERHSDAGEYVKGRNAYEVIASDSNAFCPNFRATAEVDSRHAFFAA